MNSEDEVSEVPCEILDLLRFMCRAWNEIDDWAYKHCDAEALAHYPVIQGTSNQRLLRRVGEQPYNSKNIAKAVHYMQKYNEVNL